MIWVGKPPHVSNVSALLEGHKVFTFDYLSEPHVAQVMSAIEHSDKWRESKITAGPRDVVACPTHRLQSQISVYANATQSQILFAEAFKTLLPEMADIMGLNSDALKWCSVAQYQRSVTGNFFKWHRDPSEQYPLKIITICYLSDADSHGLAGGTTDFILDDVVHSVTPRRGRCVVFDPNILHRGDIVRAGTKYAFTFGWV